MPVLSQVAGTEELGNEAADNPNASAICRPDACRRQRGPHLMDITDLLERTGRCVLNPLRATDKTDAITQLVDALARADQLSDRNDVVSAVLEREDTRSTGVGRGLAVPHGKCRGCHRLVIAVGKAVPPVEFGSTDGQPCSLIVLLASPTDVTGPHIQALASVSRLWALRDLREAVAAANTPDELYAVIKRYQQ